MAQRITPVGFRKILAPRRGSFVDVGSRRFIALCHKIDAGEADLTNLVEQLDELTNDDGVLELYAEAHVASGTAR